MGMHMEMVFVTELLQCCIFKCKLHQLYNLMCDMEQYQSVIALPVKFCCGSKLFNTFFH